MLPVAPDEVIPAVEPIPRVPPDERVNAPEPVILSAPQLRVPPVLTVIVPVVAKEFVSKVPVGLFVLLMVRLKMEIALLILKL